MTEMRLKLILEHEDFKKLVEGTYLFTDLPGYRIELVVRSPDLTKLRDIIDDLIYSPNPPPPSII